MYIQKLLLYSRVLFHFADFRLVVNHIFLYNGWLFIAPDHCIVFYTLIQTFPFVIN